MSAIGIDFGTENCYIAAIKEGVVEVLMNEYGYRATPNYIYFGKRNRDIGVSAKLNHAPHYKTTVHNLKLLIGKSYEDANNEISFLAYDIINLPDKSIGIKVNYLQDDIIFTVQQMTAIIFTKLKEIVENNLKIKAKECVISIPAFFNDNERRALLDSAKIAELDVLYLLHETTAAALFYGFFNKELLSLGNNIMFIDMGHTALQISVCNISTNAVEVLGTVWEKNLGGRNFDDLLLHHFIDKFFNKFKINILNDKRATIRLLQECEKLKKQMSTNSLNLPINIDCIIDGLDLIDICNRNTFENICYPLLLKIENTILRALSEIKITSHDINSIHIIGGCTRIPFIKKIIQNIFNKEPTTTLNQDETIAKGCALKCAFISPLIKTPNYDIIEICPFSIQLVWKSKNMENLGGFEIFKYPQKLPCSSIVTLMSNEPFILTAYTNENIEIGTFFIEDVIPIEGNNTKVDINIEINDIGLFSLKSAYLIEEKSPEEQNKLQLVKFKINNDNSIDYCKKDVKQNNSYFVNQHSGINSIQEQQEKENFNQNENYFHPLKIRSVTANLTEELLSKYKQMEETMVNKDKMEKERIEAKNSFEEYVYKMRENLFSELSLQHAMMKKVLDEAVNWLQTDGEDEEESIYYEKLEELKSYCEEFK